MSAVDLSQVCVVVDAARDNVAVAKTHIVAGTEVRWNGVKIRVRGDVAPGHRLALRAIPKGEWVRQYGQPFGLSRGIALGEPITDTNLESRVPQVDPATNPIQQFNDLATLRFPEAPTFMGYRRGDGRVGVRNWVLVVPTSMCSSHEARMISMRAEMNGAWSREKFPHVDGVTAIPHNFGCGCPDGGQVSATVKMLARYLNHPNVGAALIIELGCEKTNLAIFQNFADKHLDNPTIHGSDIVKMVYAPPKSATRIFGKPVRTIGVQGCGGTEKTIQRGLELIVELAAEANKAEREKIPITELSVGLKCGGSDGFSGLSANPALGHASDLIVANGGTTIITEIPEFFGAEHLYAQRARSRQGAMQIFHAMDRFAQYAARAHRTMSDNPSTGNKEGGLINITLKSLGALAKSGTAPVEGVIDYCAQPPHRGHWLLYCPSYDQESTPALVASGCQLVCFTTGRGTGIGNAIAPVIKIASNSEMAARMAADMDINAGGVLDGSETVETVGMRIFEEILAVAGGKLCAAERNQHREFMIWDEEGVSM